MNENVNCFPFFFGLAPQKSRKRKVSRQSKSWKIRNNFHSIFLEGKQGRGNLERTNRTMEKRRQINI